MSPPDRAGDATRTRKQVLDALKYILDDNWALHNLKFVEQALFIPWAGGRKPVETGLKRHVRPVAEERESLRKEANVLTKAVEGWVLTKAVEGWVDVEPVRCRRELVCIKERVRRLRENAATLFEASEGFCAQSCSHVLFSSLTLAGTLKSH